MAIPWCSNKNNWLLLFRLLVRFLHAADSASLIGHFAPTLDRDLCQLAFLTPPFLGGFLAKVCEISPHNSDFL
jgi:hypothetical protein